MRAETIAILGLAVGLPLAGLLIAARLLRHERLLADLQDADALHHGGIDASTAGRKRAWLRVRQQSESRWGNDDD